MKEIVYHICIMRSLGKIPSIIIIGNIYIIALVGGYIGSYFIPVPLFWRLLICDAIATLVVYIFSVFFKNTSIYDPYWSFVPWTLVLLAIIETKSHSIPIMILFAAFSLWSWRLTINWITTFENMSWEDWRYKKYREENNRVVFEIINFFGLQMMPTVLVFAALAPFLFMIENDSNYFALLGASIIIMGTLLELTADIQMHAFLRSTEEKVTCQKGLWNYSRHPNYLGEISIWFGLAIPHIIQYPTYWYYDIGAILIFLLFYLISIPLMENRQIKRRNDYEMYRKTTSKLLILPKRHIKDLQENEK